ncbi:anti-adapter protein IraP [Pectobacterium punjabense]|uniref:anti-adapter protein IraP n=1 Tax=Pectobacterium punjabense TaxID=2108399 RepID=UPI000D16A075|nr:anti-adapter protein IraP [Pectobacterium punjabense]MBS4429231.1 anti-adapter protein IraP [Pectobacterium punjabense]PTA65197.1 anti-adapter protein IraP [Pectobacterium punjabense]
MNNILSHLFIKLAEKEVGEKALNAKIESLEMLISAIVSTLDDGKINELNRKIEGVVADASQRKDECNCLAFELLAKNINRITTVSLRE